MPITNPIIDKLVYAGDALPNGIQSIATGNATPEPSNFLLLGTGTIGAFTAFRARLGRKARVAAWFNPQAALMDRFRGIRAFSLFWAISLG